MSFRQIIFQEHSCKPISSLLHYILFGANITKLISWWRWSDGFISQLLISFTTVHLGGYPSRAVVWMTPIPSMWSIAVHCEAWLNLLMGHFIHEAGMHNIVIEIYVCYIKVCRIKCSKVKKNNWFTTVANFLFAYLIIIHSGGGNRISRAHWSPALWQDTFLRMSVNSSRN